VIAWVDAGMLVQETLSNKDMIARSCEGAMDHGTIVVRTASANSALKG
jgi:hypothetical protein